MARQYAAVLALVGMSTVLFRALRHGSGVESAVTGGLSWMAIMGLVGLVVGAIAQSTIEESVRLSMEQEYAATELARQ